MRNRSSELLGKQESYSLTDLQSRSLSDLLSFAATLKCHGLVRRRKHEVVFSIMKKLAEKNAEVVGEGVLETLPEGFGFLRNPRASYLPGPDDIYVSSNQIRRFHLRTGDTVSGSIRAPKDGTERYFSLLKIGQINYEDPSSVNTKYPFENLTPIFPNQRFNMAGDFPDLTARVLDIIAPIGFGSRGLLVSPPKAGKTMMLKNIIHAIEQNHPDVYVIVLMIDERPEEVTDMIRSIKGEVFFSTFDQSPLRHTQVSEMVIEKAKRLVEHKNDVIILLDSITRLARAYNAIVPSSNKVMTGGVAVDGLRQPKKFLGSARKMEEGGSLTIIGTALIETGSKMDDIIYEEFKSTGNMEALLSRSIAESRIFPAIDIMRSGTRREDLLVPQEEIKKVWVLRKVLSSMAPPAAIAFLLDKMKNTKTNQEFFQLMKRFE